MRIYATDFGEEIDTSCHIRNVSITIKIAYEELFL